MPTNNALPTALTRYNQYKADTRDFATWLARAAIHHGYSATEFTPSNEPVGEEQAETKTKKQAKNAKRSQARKAKAAMGREEEGKAIPDAPSPTPVRGRYEIKMSSFVPIAEYLVTQGVKLPIQLILLLRRCIYRRTAYSRRFAHAADSITEQHQHFIDVLERVESVLVSGCDIIEEERDDRGHTAKAKVDKLSTDSKPLSNLFEYLALEESNEDDTPPIDIPEPPRPHGAPTTDAASFTPEADAGEVLMSLLHYLQDVHATRAYLSEVWNSYNNQSTDLLSAAVVTNTALELLQKPCQEILSRGLPVFQGKLEDLLYSLLDLLHTDACTSKSTFETNFGATPPCCEQAYDYLMMPIYQSLKSMATYISPQAQTTYVPHEKSIWSRSELLNSNDHLERYEAEREILLEGFLGYQTLVEYGSKPDSSHPHVDDSAAPKDDPLPRDFRKVFSADEMAFEIQKFVKTKSVTLFLMIAGRIYLDIHKTIGYGAAEGHYDLKNGCQRMLKSLVEYGDLEDRLCSSTLSMHEDTVVLIFIASLVKWEEVDPIAFTWDAAYSRGRVPGRQPLDRTPNLESHPLACGLIMFRLQAMFYTISLWIVNSWGTIPCASHLFSAGTRLESEHAVDDNVIWPDMNMLVKLHGQDKICGGKNEASPFANYMERRKYPLDPQSAGLSDPSPVTRLLVSKYIDFDADLRLMNRADHVDELLREMAGGASYDAELVKRLYSEFQTTVVSKKQRPIRKSTLHLLSTLQKSLESDTVSFRFDYLTMHCRCLLLLRAARTELNDHFRHVQRKGHSTCDHRLTSLFWEFLKSFNGGPGGVDGMLERRGMLRRAANVFRQNLASGKESQAELRKLWEWSPGVAQTLLGDDFYDEWSDDGECDDGAYFASLGPGDEEYWEYGLYKD